MSMNNKNETCAVITAGGAGLRMGSGKPKQFLDIAGKPVLERTLDVFCPLAFLSQIIVVAPGAHLEEAASMCERVSRRHGLRFPIRVVAGGVERQDSVYNGLVSLPASCKWVLVHDGVRPFASPGLIEAVWRASRETGASIAALPVMETVKIVNEGKVIGTYPRDQVWLAQTPQAFYKNLLLDAFRKARESGWVGTDEASLLERIAGVVTVVPGEKNNVKVTTPEDMQWAEWFLSRLT